MKQIYEQNQIKPNSISSSNLAVMKSVNIMTITIIQIGSRWPNQFGIIILKVSYEQGNTLQHLLRDSSCFFLS